MSEVEDQVGYSDAAKCKTIPGFCLILLQSSVRHHCVDDNALQKFQYPWVMFACLWDWNNFFSSFCHGMDAAVLL